MYIYIYLYVQYNIHIYIYAHYRSVQLEVRLFRPEPALGGARVGNLRIHEWREWKGKVQGQELDFVWTQLLMIQINLALESWNLVQAMTAGFMSLATSSYFGSEELRATARGKKETDSIRVAWNSQVKLEHQHMEWQAPLAVKRSCQNNQNISKHHEEFHLLIYHLDLCFHEKKHTKS